jgi:hypothetical protein
MWCLLGLCPLASHAAKLSPLPVFSCYVVAREQQQPEYCSRLFTTRRHFLLVDPTREPIANKSGPNKVSNLCQVNPNFDYPQLLPIVRSVRAKMPTIFLGVNFTTMNGAEAFPILGRLARLVRPAPPCLPVPCKRQRNS